MGTAQGGGKLRRGAMLLVAASCLAIGSAAAEIYRCDDHGRMSFRDKPCAAKEKQTRIGAAQAVYAGCYQVEESAAKPAGAGAWRIKIISNESGYLFQEVAVIAQGKEQPAEAANVPMHRATPEELEAAAHQTLLKPTSGIVLELPPDPSKRVMGLFNAWDAEGHMQLMAYLPFGSGAARRVACP